MEREIEKFLKNRRECNEIRDLAIIDDCKNESISINGTSFINFSSNDYLSFSSHPLLIKARKQSYNMFSMCSSRLVTGTTKLHYILEQKIADFKGKEDALVFNSGYQANLGIISAFYKKNDVIFSDKLNHASIVDGIKLSGAKFFRFKHNDIEHLKILLEKNRKLYKNALIVTESIFSMDGDIAPIKDLVGLKEKYNCQLMVDEAHATGVFGDKGKGVIDSKNLSDCVDIIMGTFSKAFGGFGAYVVLSKLLKEYLVNTCRSFIYSTSLPIPVIYTNLMSLELLKTQHNRGQVVLNNSEYLRKKLKQNGFLVKGESQIVPIIVKDVKDLFKLSDFLKRKGYWVVPIRPPTVPKNESRLRLSLTYNITRDIINNFVSDISNF